MYAILEHGGHQYRVTAGDRLLVDRLPADVGSIVALEPVVLFSDGERLEVGGEAVAGMRVAATVISHRRGRKLRVFKYKAKKRNRRTLGFRADLTELVVASVLRQGEALPEPAAPTDEVEAEPEKPRGRARGARPAAKAAEAEPEVVVDDSESGVTAAPTSEVSTPSPAAEGPRSATEAAAVADAPETSAAHDAPEDAEKTDAAPVKRRRAARKPAEAEADEPSSEA
jgi:large subunit ribosomal protein L21